MMMAFYQAVSHDSRHFLFQAGEDYEDGGVYFATMATYSTRHNV